MSSITLSILTQTLLMAAVPPEGLQMIERGNHLEVVSIRPSCPLRGTVRPGDSVLEIAGIPTGSRRAWDSIWARLVDGEQVSLRIRSGAETYNQMITVGAGRAAATPAPSVPARTAPKAATPAVASTKRATQPAVGGSAPQAAAEVSTQLNETPEKDVAAQRVFGASGPGKGRASFGFGGALTFGKVRSELRYLHDLDGKFAVDSELRTTGVTTEAMLGARMKVFERGNAAIAVRARITGLIDFGGTTSFFSAAQPGAVFSIGGNLLEFSAGLDIPIYYAGWIEGTGGAVAYLGHSFNPFAALEMSLTDSMNGYVHVQTQILEFGGEASIVPYASLGLSF